MVTICGTTLTMEKASGGLNYLMFMKIKQRYDLLFSTTGENALREIARNLKFRFIGEASELFSSYQLLSN